MKVGEQIPSALVTVTDDDFDDVHEYGESFAEPDNSRIYLLVIGLSYGLMVLCVFVIVLEIVGSREA